MRRGYVDTSQGQVHFREGGEGTPLVLLHQSPSSSAMWEMVIPVFADRGYRAVAFDMPGFGMSDPPTREPDLGDYAAWVFEACDVLGLERPHVFGHHTGGSVALKMAHLRPEGVGKVAVWGAALLDEELAHSLATEEPPEYDEDATEIVRFWKSRGKASGKALTQHIGLRNLIDMLQTEEIRPYGHHAVGTTDHEPLIEKLPVPLLALAGDHEMLREGSERAAEMAPDGTYVSLGDVGIDVADEAPERLVDVVHQFFAG